VIDFNKPADLSCARTADPFSNPLSVPDLEYYLLMTGFPNFVPGKENWIQGYMKGAFKKELPAGKGSEGLG
jgi:hypothetical protein